MARHAARLLPATNSLHRTRIIVLITSIVVLLICSTSRATVIVNDTWQDGTRTDPAAPVYSENGVVSDHDNDIESAWFSNGTGASLTASTGQMLMTAGSSSFSAQTYFTAPGYAAKLSSPGDTLVVSWTFTTGTVSASNTSQTMYYALVDSSAVARPTADSAGTPSGVFPGYLALANLSNPLGNSSPFQLREWGSTAGPGATSGAVVGSTTPWVAESPNVNGATSGNHGYDNNTSYTMTWTLTYGNVTGSDLKVDIKMQQNNGTIDLNGSGSEEVIYDDTTPNSLKFDSFVFRSSGGSATSNTFTSTNFEVTGPLVAVPEPASLVLTGLGAGALGFVALRRKNVNGNS